MHEMFLYKEFFFKLTMGCFLNTPLDRYFLLKQQFSVFHEKNVNTCDSFKITEN